MDEPDHHPGPCKTPESFIVPRPPFQLRSLPIRWRWEVTRRHPYYQLAWQRAREHLKGTPSGSEFESLLRQLAVRHLTAIGVSGEPPDPTVPFEQLGAEQLNDAWLSGAVHPISIRGMVAGMLATVSPETTLQLANVFLRATKPEDADRLPSVDQALEMLYRSESSDLDSYFDEPIVSINPVSSEKKIHEALDRLLAEWKEKKGLSAQRDRSDKFGSYIEVWDRREGWTGSGYDRGRELPLKKIAQEIKRPIPTVADQYLRAFQLVTGHSYNRERWFQLFRPLKLCELVTGEATLEGMRPLKSPSRKPISESILLPGHDWENSLGMVGSASAVDDGAAIRQLRRDIESLLSAGASNEEIVETLELKPDSTDLVEYFRQRRDIPE